MKFMIVFFLLINLLFAKDSITVIDLTNLPLNFSETDKRTTEELLRAEVSKAIEGKLFMVDKENLYEILKDNQVDISKCLNESQCEVELFRKINVDYGITPVLLKIDDKYKLLLKLYEAERGEVLKVLELYGKSVADFDKELKVKTT